MGSQWLQYVEIATFLLMFLTFLYNRMVSWRTVREEVASLKNSFEQYQRDFKIYIETCESCRKDVRSHHERMDQHVTPDLRLQITQMADDIADIKRYLMEHKVS